MCILHERERGVGAVGTHGRGYVESLRVILLGLISRWMSRRSIIHPDVGEGIDIWDLRSRLRGHQTFFQVVIENFLGVTTVLSEEAFSDVLSRLVMAYGGV